MVHRATPARRRPGRPSLLSREMIADTAIELIAEQGIDALTFQNIATSIGVKHPALYRHVNGRPDLLRAVADRFMETTHWPTPDGDDWRQYLRAVARAIDTECGRYPGMMDLIYNQVWPMPRRLILAALEMTENLVALGFPRKLALVAADIVADFAADTRIRRDRISQHTGEWGGFTDSLTSEDARYAEMSAAFSEHFALGPDSWTEEKLEIILDGIESRLQGRRAGENIASSGDG